MKTDGSDSIAIQRFPAEHWPEMRILILVVSDVRKKYSSTIGMRTSVETSELLKYRTQNVVPKRLSELKEALLEKDFHKFAEITMKESNTFHACCFDTYPPMKYMNDVSYAIVEMVHAFNDFCGENKVIVFLLLHINSYKIRKYFLYRLHIHLMQDPMRVCFY